MSFSSDNDSTTSTVVTLMTSTESILENSLSTVFTPSKTSFKNNHIKIIPYNTYSFPFHPEEVKLMGQLISKVRYGIKKRHIIPDDITDHQIAQFLNVDLDVEKTISLMEKHFTFKLFHPDMFSKHAVANIDTFVTRSFLTIAPFPCATDEGYQLIYVGFQPLSPDKVDFPACGRFLALAVEALLISTGILPGHIIILDITYANDNLFGLKRIPEYKSTLTYLQECTALKIIEIVILNIGMVCEHEYAKYLEPWIIDDIEEKIFYSPYGLKNLVIEFGEKVLPEELGGTCGTLIEHEERFHNTVLRCQEWVYSKKDDPYGFNLDKSC